MSAPNGTISAQMAFALHLAEMDQYATADGAIYRWIETHWEPSRARDLERDAQAFVFYFCPAKANEKLAQSAVATAANHLPPLPRRAADEKTLIPTLNGYVEIDGESQELRPAAKEDGITYVLNCGYSPGARCARFDDFLAEALPDEGVRDYLQEYAGYTLLGDTRHQLAAWLIGAGGTGKGTFAIIMQALHRRTVALSLDALDGFKLAGLPGASLVFVDETPTGRIDEQRIKTLVSGDTMQVDIKYRDPLTIRPTAKWIVNGNALPAISDHSSGFWRRWLIFPFEVVPSKKQPLLAEHIIEAELSGVLNWALAGLRRLLARGQFPDLPPAMQRAQNEGRQESNSVLGWCEDQEIEIATDGTSVPKPLVYQRYASWCSANGLKSVSSINFWRRMVAALPGLEHSQRRSLTGRQRTVNLVLPDEAEACNAAQYFGASGG